MEFNEYIQYFGKGIFAAPEVYEAITKKQIKSNVLGISPRILNYWKNKGLLLYDPPYDKHQHILFSFEDYVWFCIINELRKFDLKLSIIKEIKESLFFPIPVDELLQEPKFVDEVIKKLPENKKVEFLDLIHNPIMLNELKESLIISLLSLLIIQAIIHRQHVALLVNYDGEVLPLPYNEIEKWLDDSLYINFIKKTHISVSLSEIIIRFITDNESELSHSKFQLISEREAEILRLLREEKLDSLVIHFGKDNSISLIEIQEKYNKVDKEMRLVDLIFKNGYQNLELKTEKGQIVYCKNIRKIKL
jgi:DNA-binding transcriptional MerR regulator